MSFFGKGKSKEMDDFEGTSFKYPRCYVTHDPLKLGKGVLFGGSASNPVVQDADVYVSLQGGSTCGLASDPWAQKRVTEVFYPIFDQHAPTNVSRFKKMVTWLCNQLQDGKRVHVGCIGGHGRTGVVLSAIVAELLGEKDAIQWVRKNYCKKAVESREQVKFLMKHYGVSNAEGSKEHLLSSKLYEGYGERGFNRETGEIYDKTPKLVKHEAKGSEVVQRMTPEGACGDRTFAPLVSSSRCIWKKKKVH